MNNICAQPYCEWREDNFLNNGVHGSHAACLSTTYELGHTLDLIITRTSDNIIAACPCIGELFSDHFPVIVFHFPDKLDTLMTKRQTKLRNSFV